MKKAGPTFKVEGLRDFFFESVPQRKILVCRALLGWGLFAFYLSFVPSRPPFLGSPRLGGFELPFPPVPQAFNQPLISAFLYALALASSLAFAFGYRTLLAGVVTLVLHGLFFGNGTVPFGWGGFLDPFLVCVILATRGGADREKTAAWPFRLLQLGICGMYALNAWGQWGQKPWLDPHAIAYYVEGSPFGHAFAASYRGFVPLVEILGGLAWLAQIVAPLLLWAKRLSPYLALSLIALHGLLELFMPAYFWNYAMIAALVAFLPAEWLSLDRAHWARNAPERRLAWRGLGFFMLMATMLCTLFERNIAQQFDIFGSHHGGAAEEAYQIATRPFSRAGNLILFNSMWKMYSPVWRHVVWIEWYYRRADQSVANWPQENFSPDYRLRRRTWLEALWTDFKKEKVFVGMLSGTREKVAYGNYLCHEIEARSGVRPLSVHPEIYSFDIRGPEEDWSIERQALEKRDVKEEVPCE